MLPIWIVTRKIRIRIQIFIKSQTEFGPRGQKITIYNTDCKTDFKMSIIWKLETIKWRPCIMCKSPYVWMYVCLYTPRAHTKGHVRRFKLFFFVFNMLRLEINWGIHFFQISNRDFMSDFLPETGRYCAASMKVIQYITYIKLIFQGWEPVMCIRIRIHLGP